VEQEHGCFLTLREWRRRLQGGQCSCDGIVRFGQGSTWTPAVRVKGSISCSAGKDFKDPAPSKAKVLPPPEPESDPDSEGGREGVIEGEKAECWETERVRVCWGERNEKDGGGWQQVCMCSPATWPVIPSSESFATTASSSKAKKVLLLVLSACDACHCLHVGLALSLYMLLVSRVVPVCLGCMRRLFIIHLS
jgi:hypothetical protein